MKFTMSWLRDHLDTEASAEAVAEALTDAGLEVESIGNAAAGMEAFTICRVREARKHPNADRLSVCVVETFPDGQGSAPVLEQVVCGAPNARTGLVGVFAPAGTRIPGTGLELKASEIRGVESRGMLCSKRELNISDEHDRIIDLPTDAPLGALFVDYFGLDDPVVEIAVTPNRPDALGVRGIARDLAARGFGRLKPAEVASVHGRFRSKIPVSIDEELKSKACPAFFGRVIRGVENNKSPDWIQKRLKAVGLRPISALVDITNYVMLDRNRPLHAFDADKVSGGLRVHFAEGGEKVVALDGTEYEFEKGMIAISDANGVESIAGIMGGEATGCTSDTVNVFLESALWDPIATAATGRRLKIESDARYRFERGVDPDFTIEGLDFATALILRYCGGKASEIVGNGKILREKRRLKLDPYRIESITGIEIGRKTQVEILESLGFMPVSKSRRITVTVPSWRPDIGCEVDLAQEVALIASLSGLEGAPLKRIAPGVSPSVLTLHQKHERAVRSAMTAALILRHCGGETSEIVGDSEIPRKTHIKLHPYKAECIAGMVIKRNTQVKILKSLDFKPVSKPERIAVTVPPWRPDIGGEAELAEEVALIASLSGLKGAPLRGSDFSVSPSILTPLQKRERAARRVLAAALILRCHRGEASEIVGSGKVQRKKRALKLDPYRVRSIKGMVVGHETQVEILESLGFKPVSRSKPERIAVTVPSWRPDIGGEADLAEEVALIASLSEPERAPLVAPGVLSSILTPSQRRERAVRSAMTAALILRHCGGLASEIVGGGKVSRKKCRLDLYPHEIESVTGMAVRRKTQVEILDSLGFKPMLRSKPERIAVTVPSWRPDIGCEADLAEEVALIASLSGSKGHPLPRPPTPFIYRPSPTPLQKRERAARRALAAALILRHCGNNASEIVGDGEIQREVRTLKLRRGRVKSLTGLEIETEAQIDILESLGFEPEFESERIAVTVPSWRPDVGGEADLVEEVARVASLSGLKGAPLRRASPGVSPQVLTPLQKRERAARRALAALGYNECVTYSFVDEDLSRHFMPDSGPVKLDNPISSSLNVMRPNLLPGLLRAAARNQAHGYADLALFEVGPVFSGSDPEDQRLHATGLLIGSAGPREPHSKARQVDLFDAKADSESILAAIGASADRISRDVERFWHPGRSGCVLGPNGDRLAVFGEINPRVLKAAKIRGTAVGFTVHIDPPREGDSERAAGEALRVPDLQVVERDFAFVVDVQVEAAAVLSAARSSEFNALFESVSVFDEFAGPEAEEQLGEGKKSLAISVRIQPEERSFKDAQLEEICADVVKRVENQVGGQQR